MTERAETRLCIQLETAFNRQFGERRRVRLEGGHSEPLYLPASDGCASIRYRERYFSSALHELAHWCIAGAAREQQVDYGYWYAPDGRSAEQQRLFERVESGPQALEWLFAGICGHAFHFSADNLDPSITISDAFRERVTELRNHWRIAWRNGPEAARSAGLSAKAVEVLDFLQRESGAWKEAIGT